MEAKQAGEGFRPSKVPPRPPLLIYSEADFERIRAHHGAKFAEAVRATQERELAGAGIRS